MSFGSNAGGSDGISELVYSERRRMQTLKTASCLLVAVALGSGVVPAQGGHTTIRGAGASSCSAYARLYDAFRLSSERTADFLQYEEWIDGYILGMDTSFKGAGAPRDWNQVDIGKWISDYCQDHPSDIVANAALALFKEIRAAPF
jgi:hypothetical protein